MMGDYDGVVVVPKKIEKEVLELAFEKVSKEKMTRQELLEGKLLRKSTTSTAFYD